MEDGHPSRIWEHGRFKNGRNFKHYHQPCCYSVLIALEGWKQKEGKASLGC